MKVVLIHDKIRLAGAPETRLLNYFQEFHERGHRLSVIVSEVDEGIELPSGIEIIKIPLPNIPTPYKKLLFNFRLKKALKGLNADFTLSLWRTSHQQAVLCPGNHRGYLKAMDKPGWKLRDRIQDYLDHQAYENSELILATSKMVKRELIHFYQVPAEHIKVLYPPVNTDIFNPGIKQLQKRYRRRFGLHDNKQYFVFISTSNRRKGLPLLLRIFSHLRDSTFHLLLAGPNLKNPKLPNVTNLGFVENTNELLAAADCLIHPARYEPFGQVVIEAIQSGTPVIVSDMVGASELISPAEGIVVSDFKESSWVKAIHAAAEKSFHLTGEFAQKQGLTLPQHIDRMLAYAREFELIPAGNSGTSQVEETPN